jgi:hypothetical protein
MALGIFSAFVSWRQQQILEEQEMPLPLSSHSAAPGGTLGLYLWLEELGFQTVRIENQAFAVPDEARLLFVHSPIEAITANEANSILEWVERGNTLYVSDEALFSENELFQELDARLEFGSFRDMVTPTQPIADAEIGELQADARSVIGMDRDDFVSYADGDGNSLLVRLEHGAGTIWLSGAPELLTNEALRDEDNAKFAAAMVGELESGSVIAFDEYHLGLKSEEEGGLGAVIYNSPWGWGLILAGLILFGYLVLNGQRFGRVLPMPRALGRRSPSEYVTSMANLFRRANKRGMVLNHYRHSLKRRLGRPYHLNPELDDGRFIEMLERLRPELNRNELTRILNSLRKSDTSESELVKTVEQSVTFGGHAARK